MRPLFFLAGYLFLHAHLLLIPQVFSDAGGADSCNSTSQCSTLNNITYPFGSSVLCAESDNFVLSNCSSGNPTWDSFTRAIADDAAASDHGNHAPPTVLGIYEGGYSNVNSTWEAYTYVNLTWNSSLLSTNSCGAPLPARDLSLYLPDAINLTDFDQNSTLFFTLNNILLLLNCSTAKNISGLPNSTLTENSTKCIAYQSQCGSIGSCVQYTPNQQLMLREAMDNLSCSHFQFFVVPIDNTPVPSWSKGLVQLLVQSPNTQCGPCTQSKGSCVFDNTKLQFVQCYCGNGKYSATDCYHIPGCGGHFSCNTGAKIATGVSVTVVGTLIATMVVLWICYKKRVYTTSWSFRSSSSHRIWTQRAIMLSRKFGPVSTKEFSFEELHKATKSFADENLIGDGGFGAVFVGVLKDGRKVAIKRLYHDSFRRMDHFYNEIKILSDLDHANLVRLYGFCCQDSNDLLLVFEYASKGTVSDQLHDERKPPMPWKVRLNIARETAEALSYLHNRVPPIYHRDVKTTNILLDDGLHAKLADFGLSRLVPLEVTHVSTAPQGTPGYVDPDYHNTYQLTDKSDVYSFGVVLMELVSAKMAVDMSRDRREINLSSMALMKIGCGAWEELVDPRLEIKKNPDMEAMVKRVVELAFLCLHAEKDDRPTMKHVAETLVSLCKEFGYNYDDAGSNINSSKVDVSAPCNVDERIQLIKCKTVPNHAGNSADSLHLSDWTGSNPSSYGNSF